MRMAMCKYAQTAFSRTLIIQKRVSGQVPRDDGGEWEGKPSTGGSAIVWRNNLFKESLFSCNEVLGGATPGMGQPGVGIMIPVLLGPLG